MANKNLFQQIQVTGNPRSTFDLSHDVKFTGQMGKLIPVLAMDVLPSDNINLGCESLIKFAPMSAPPFHRYNATIHYFFCPNRILWPNWEKYIVDPSTALVHPFINITDDLGIGNLEILDYFGIPPCPPATSAIPINALPFAAYMKIYNDYYRDQNLIPELTTFNLIDGDNSIMFSELQTFKRAWEHDYFTSALPFAQKSTPVQLPLGKVVLDPYQIGEFQKVEDISGNPMADGTVTVGAGGAGNLLTGGANARFDPNGTLSVGATTITDLRRAFKLQEYLEKAARAGTRYVEYLKAFFEVRKQDARLDRPEYITGTKTPIIISEVLNTGDVTVQGNMSGHGVGVMQDYGETYRVQEHGWIIGIMSVLPVPAYQQGIEKQYLKINDPMEYYVSNFAHIGEQEVNIMELYVDAADRSEVFGYVPRYSEYKYKPSRSAGDFKTTLDNWTSTRIFATEPALNQEFIECVPDDRIFNVTDPAEDKLYIQVYNKIRASRPMDYYGSPKM